MTNTSGILALPTITTRVLQKHQRRRHNLVVVLLGGCAFEIESGNPYNGLATRTYFLIRTRILWSAPGRKTTTAVQCTGRLEFSVDRR